MKTAIVYGSTHGRTAKAVAHVARDLKTPADVFNVKQLQDPSLLATYDLLLFFSPTYGDEELQKDMEEFFLRFDLDLSGKFFAICELGSYYGYDDFAFGAMRLIRHHLAELHGQELCEPLSLDSFPKVNWEHLLNWIDYLNGKIYEQFGYCCS